MPQRVRDDAYPGDLDCFVKKNAYEYVFFFARCRMVGALFSSVAPEYPVTHNFVCTSISGIQFLRCDTRFTGLCHIMELH